jgi:hypothetical protein
MAIVFMCNKVFHIYVLGRNEAPGLLVKDAMENDLVL